MTIIEERLEAVPALKSGAHRGPDDGMCLLEAVAWVAGEPWSDHPQCVDPVLASFGRAWNDSLGDDDRTRLLAPFVPRLVGTRSTSDVQDRRAFMAADWAVRVFTPAWLRLAGLDEHATALSVLNELSSVESCRDAMDTIAAAGAAAGDAVRDAAWDAAGAAAGAAVRDAAGAAVRDAAGAAAGAAVRAAVRAAAWAAAWDAAWDAAGAAARAAVRDAAWDAAGAAAGAAVRAAAWDAAWDAAWAAAWAALAPTVTELQASAVDLFERMIEVTA